MRCAKRQVGSICSGQGRAAERGQGGRSQEELEDAVGVSRASGVFQNLTWYGDRDGDSKGILGCAPLGKSVGPGCGASTVSSSWAGGAGLGRSKRSGHPVIQS